MIHQTLEKLHELRLGGCAQAIQEQLQDAKYYDLSFEERLALIIDREYIKRQNGRLAKRIKQAKLKTAATIENVDFQLPRQLDKALFLQLASCSWIQNRQNLLITGLTGLGKTFLACALADKACRLGFRAFYIKAADLCAELLLSRADGSYALFAAKLAKNHLLIIDEWLRDPLSEKYSRELHDVMDDRYLNSSTLFVSQILVPDWHSKILDPTIADALLDRLIHNAIRIKLDGESIRKLKGINVDDQHPPAQRPAGIKK